MELDQLKNFYVIAQHESITKAAQKLHMSQPSLSRSLHSLENELGTQLFDRVGRHIVLNDAGRFMQGKVLDVLNSAESIRNDLDKFVSDESLFLDVYTPVPMGDFESIIIGFKSQYPNVRLRMASFPSERLKNATPSITFFASTTIHTERNYLLLGKEDAILAVSPESPLAQRESVALAELSNEKFVSTLSDSPFYEITTCMFAQAGFEPNIIAEDQDCNRVLAYVANGFGIAVAPSVTWFGIWRDKVVQVPISDVHAGRYLYLKWPENAVLNQATMHFRDYVVEHYNTRYGFTCNPTPEHL